MWRRVLNIAAATVLVGGLALLVYFAGDAGGGGSSPSDGGGDPSAAPPAASPGAGKYWPNATALPGDPHTWDNQIIFACVDDTTSGPAFGYTGGLGGDPFAPYVVKAICKWESGFNPAAKNTNPGSNSYGLMQVDLQYHPEFSEADMLDPNLSILAGTAILAGNYEAAAGNWLAAVAAYGPSDNPNYAPGVLAIARNYAAQAGLNLV